MKFSVKTQGFAQMEAGLAEFSKATARNVLLRAGIDAMQPVATTMGQKAPKDAGDLKDAVDVGTRTNAGREFKDSSVVEVYAGVSVVGGGMPPQAIQQEFGNEHHGPQAYARPGWDAEKGAVLDRLAGSLGAEIDKATARAQRKALKAKR